MNFDPKEAAAAAKMSAACEHVRHVNGTCLYCGALAGDNNHWEPPLRRTPLFVEGSFDGPSVARAIFSNTPEALQALVSFADKLESFLREHQVSGYAGVLLGVGAGILVTSGVSDEQAHEALNTSIQAARGNLKLHQGNA